MKKKRFFLDMTGPAAIEVADLLLREAQAHMEKIDPRNPDGEYDLNAIKAELFSGLSIQLSVQVEGKGK